jgi:hypothetical protein
MQWIINYTDYIGISQSCLNGFIIISHLIKYKGLLL